VKLKPSEYRVAIGLGHFEPQLWEVVETDKIAGAPVGHGWVGALVWVRRVVRGVDPRAKALPWDDPGSAARSSIATGRLDPDDLPPEIEAKWPKGSVEMRRTFVVRAHDGSMEVRDNVLVTDYLDLVAT